MKPKSPVSIAVLVTEAAITGPGADLSMKVTLSSTFGMVPINYPRWLVTYSTCAWHGQPWGMSSVGIAGIQQKHVHCSEDIQPLLSNSIDLANMQNTAHVEYDGCAFRPTENTELLQRWMVADSRISHLVGELSLNHQNNPPVATIHEPGRAGQANFGSHIQSMTIR